MSAIGGALGGIAGGIIGKANEAGDYKQSEARYEDMVKALQGYKTQAAGQGGTQFDKIDPTARNAMLQALADYSNKAKAGGLDARAQAALEQGVARGQQGAAQSAAQVQGEAARRGAAQGPASMIAQQVAQQQAAQGSRNAGLQSGAMAEEARMAALQGQLGAAGQVHAGDAQRAAAQDAINRFNVLNSQQNIQNEAARQQAVSGAQKYYGDVYERRAGNDVGKETAFGAGMGKNVGSIAEFGAGGGFGGLGGMAGSAMNPANQRAMAGNQALYGTDTVEG